MKTEDASEGDWRRTDEEPQLALPDDDERLGLGSGGSQLHQNDGGCHYCDRYGSVQGDAELAMIGVDGVGVQVRDLRDRDGRKQHQAQARDNREQKRPAALIPADKCLNCRQTATSTLILPKSLNQFDVLATNWLLDSTFD
jgi:hypothetical protein